MDQFKLSRLSLDLEIWLKGLMSLDLRLGGDLFYLFAVDLSHVADLIFSSQLIYLG